MKTILYIIKAMKDNTSITNELLSDVIKEQLVNFLNIEHGVKREIIKQIDEVIKSPLITVITGLRRVGKSTLLSQIANKYFKDEYYYINFEDERLIDFKVTDFDRLVEVFAKEFGDKRVFLFDEIQNIPEWERFVRRMHDQGYKFVITGSNASLLSQELGTRLTGRTIVTELFPFSFNEYLLFVGKSKDVSRHNFANIRGNYIRLAEDYLIKGGIPDALKYPKIEVHKSIYNDVLYRDIVTRYKLENVRALKELAFQLVSNISSLISYNKLKNQLKLGSVNTVINYIDYFENSWLFFFVNKYAFSVKEQQIAAKKIYGIDTGMAKSIGFSFSENIGKATENAVFLHLKRKYKDIYYFVTDKGREIDFFIPEINTYIQVCTSLDSTDTYEREIRPLVEVGKLSAGCKLLIINDRLEKTVTEEGLDIELIPLHVFLRG